MKESAAALEAPVLVDMNLAVAAVLRARRHEVKGLTLAILAERVGMKLTTLRQTLAGDRIIGVAEVFTFAKVFNVTGFDLIAEAEQRLAK